VLFLNVAHESALLTALAFPIPTFEFNGTEQ
jgi:hypothetical protein